MSLENNNEQMISMNLFIRINEYYFYQNYQLSQYRKDKIKINRLIQTKLLLQAIS